jgi:NADPH:quinone reductase-like Zn-dependent oxidoreductase
MRAIRIHRFGDPEVLELNDVPISQPGENELLVRIHGASVNPIDYKIRRGAVPAITPDVPPITLGRDGSGTIEAIGPGMNAFRQGELV